MYMYVNRVYNIKMSNIAEGPAMLFYSNNGYTA